MLLRWPVPVHAPDAESGAAAAVDPPAGAAEPATADPAKGEPAKAAEGDPAPATAKDGEKPADPAPVEFDPAGLKMPEGVEVDPAMLGEMTPVLKDLKLNTEQAQKLTDAYVKVRQAEAEKFAETVQDWAKQAQADAEIGGAKWDDSKFAALRAIEKLGTPELKSYLEFSGAGNHPEIIRFAARAGKLIADDKPVIGSIAAGEKADPVSVLYPKKG